MGQYIARLMMIGFSARSAYEIYKDFQAEHDFAGLNDFISILEEEKCSPCGVNIILIRQEEKSETVPSER